MYFKSRVNSLFIKDILFIMLYLIILYSIIVLTKGIKKLNPISEINVTIIGTGKQPILSRDSQGFYFILAQVLIPYLNKFLFFVFLKKKLKNMYII